MQNPLEFIEPFSSIEHCQLYADKGNTMAQNQLFYCYLHGVLVDQDYKQALKWVNKAAKLNDATAIFNLAVLNREGLLDPDGKVYVTPNRKKCFELLLLAAQEGHTPAQCAVGLCYQFGEGTSIDYAQAAHWIAVAAQNDDPDAIYALAQMYDLGIGVDADEEKFLHYLEKAAQLGDENARFDLAMMAIAQFYDADIPQDMPSLQKAFDRMFILAKEDFDQAKFELAIMYLRGIGTKIDKQKGFSWMLEAAKTGLSEAQYVLGALYHNGEGVAADVDKGLDWLILAALQNHEGALESVKQIMAENENHPDKERLLAMLEQTIALGDDNVIS